MMSFGADWDTFGRLVMAVGFLAFLVYFAPSVLPLSPHWGRYFDLASMILIGAAIFLALGGTVVWYLG
jgi:hypothetical protein